MGAMGLIVVSRPNSQGQKKYPLKCRGWVPHYAGHGMEALCAVLFMSHASPSSSTVGPLATHCIAVVICVGGLPACIAVVCMGDLPAGRVVAICEGPSSSTLSARCWYRFPVAIAISVVGLMSVSVVAIAICAWPWPLASIVVNSDWPTINQMLRSKKEERTHQHLHIFSDLGGCRRRQRSRGKVGILQEENRLEKM